MSTQPKSPVVKLLQGNEACAEAAIAAGCRFFGGYPISPSSEIAEHMSVRMPQVGGRFIQMEDEIAAMGCILGAAMTGAKAMTATSGPGYSLKQENIGYAIMAEIPCVIVNVMRGGPSTGLPTMPAQADVMQARWGTHGDHPGGGPGPGLGARGLRRDHPGLQHRRALSHPRDALGGRDHRPHAGADRHPGPERDHALGATAPHWSRRTSICPTARPPPVCRPWRTSAPGIGTT